MLQVFQIFMDSLFQSFNQQVSMNNFAELSGCVFSWIEEQCKPGDLQDLMFQILRVTYSFSSTYFLSPSQTGRLSQTEPC